MEAPALKPGDLVGFVSPSSKLTPEGFAPVIAAWEARGYRIRLGKNLYAHGWGYAATDEERAEDFNAMAQDDEVKLICFSGGAGSNEVIPLLDFEAIARHPKRYLSYSDGTSILNTIWNRAGINTYYGQTPNDALKAADSYTAQNFHLHMEQEGHHEHLKGSQWVTLTPGKARGTLTGGYLGNYLYLTYSGWINPKPGQDYILFVEDHEQFYDVNYVSDSLTRLEKSPMMKQVKGLLFGEYAKEPNPDLMNRLKLLGERMGIPVAYCADFGHGESHAILNIGLTAILDTEEQTLCYE